jgi:membrane-associated protease RseP (regulator of RpoE activity)
MKTWRTNALLFLATLVSVFLTGTVGAYDGTNRPTALLHGASFAGALLTILVAHELGHYITARIHRVDASLPYFLPMPLLSPFGTMGAVIRMRGVIPTRRALLDIGASGPLAGLAFAIPIYAWGVAHSHFAPAGGEGLVDLGESLLTRGLDRLFAPTPPEGMVLVYSPVAFGAWGGLFVTMINLLPVGQLDGGHVAYALFGPRQDRIASTVHRAMLAFFFVAVVGHVGRDISAGRGITSALLARHVSNALFWLVWFQMLAILGTLASKGRKPPEGERNPVIGLRTRIGMTVALVVLSGSARENPSPLSVIAFFTGLLLLIAMEIRSGTLRPHALLDHPPTSDQPLDLKRQIIAVFTLIVFALLFMPEPFSL